MKTLLALLLLCALARAEDVTTTLAWDANQEPDLAGYRLYIGFAHGIYGTAINVTATEKTITYPKGTLLYAAVTAINTAGDESPKSAELIFQNAPTGERTIPGPPGGLHIKAQVKVSVLISPDLRGPWTVASVATYTAGGPNFFAALLLE